MPKDNWDDPDYFKDRMDTILNSPRVRTKLARADKEVTASVESPAVPTNVDIEDDDDFWFAEPVKKVETPAIVRCAKPVNINNLLLLPPEQLSTNPDIAHLAKCSYCQARYQAEKQRRETS